MESLNQQNEGDVKYPNFGKRYSKSIELIEQFSVGNQKEELAENHNSAQLGNSQSNLGQPSKKLWNTNNLAMTVSQHKTKEEGEAFNYQNTNWLNILAQNLRITQVLTMVCGILISDKQNQTSVVENKDLNEEHFKEVITVQLNNQILGQNYKNLNSSIKIFESEIKLYAPKPFLLLQKMDNIMVDIQKSFNINENYKKISSEFDKPDGGRQGQFFYFSQDLKLIFKTISSVELNNILQHLEQYFKHVYNSDTFITKFYGIYTLKRKDTNQELSFFITRHISQCPSIYNERAYDLKGSKYQRQVISNYQVDNETLKKRTLKDIDFQTIEGKMHLPKQQIDKCTETLIKDSEFLEKCGFIDYSLVVFKVDWIRYIQENGSSIEEIQKKFSSPLYMIQSTKEGESHLYYHMGIVDYLQKWTVKKISENKVKKIVNLDINLDVSSQNPQVYGNRFRKKVAIIDILGQDQTAYKFRKSTDLLESNVM